MEMENETSSSGLIGRKDRQRNSGEIGVAQNTHMELILNCLGGHPEFTEYPAYKHCSTRQKHCSTMES